MSCGLYYFSGGITITPLISEIGAEFPSSASYFAAALILILGHFSLEPVKLLFLLLFAALIVLNARFYMVLAGKRGKLFALAAIPFHLLFHLYSGLAFGFGFIRFYVAKPFRRDSRRNVPYGNEGKSDGAGACGS